VDDDDDDDDGQYTPRLRHFFPERRLKLLRLDYYDDAAAGTIDFTNKQIGSRWRKRATSSSGDSDNNGATPTMTSTSGRRHSLKRRVF
jgi:hypothetical protein